MKYPGFLNRNDTIGFVSPSFGCSIEPYRSAFANALKRFNKMGYVTDVGPNCYKSDGIGISTTPEKCGREFMEYYLSDKNKCIMSCGGGELMCEVLDYIDFERLSQAEPKWFMGYSDNTNMTFLLVTVCDVAAIYGPCAAAFGMEPWHEALNNAMDIVGGRRFWVSNYEKWEKESLKTSDKPLEPYNVTEPFKLKKYPDTDIHMAGRLIGGCLDCLSTLAGTKYDRVKEFVKKYKSDGIIWFLESCDLNVMSIRRAMWQLDRSGWFQYTKGFIIGRPYCYGQEIMGLNQYDAIMGVVEKYNVPVVMDVDIGHLAPMMPLVTGSMADVISEGNGINIKMKYV